MAKRSLLSRCPSYILFICYNSMQHGGGSRLKVIINFSVYIFPWYISVLNTSRGLITLTHIEM